MGRREVYAKADSEQRHAIDFGALIDGRAGAFEDVDVDSRSAA
jgi:hypothetical protein